jgi:hypothetical protein
VILCKFIIDLLLSETKWKKKQKLKTPTGLAISEPLDAENAIQFFKKNASIMWNWIDKSVTAQLGSDFPENVIETRGKAITDIIYSFSGRKIAGLTPISICNFPKSYYSHTSFWKI